MNEKRSQGSIHNRDKFLDGIAERLGRARKSSQVIRPQWSVQPQWDVLTDATADDLVDVLEKQCEEIHTDFIRTNSEQLEEALCWVIKQYGGESLIMWDDERFQDYGLLEDVAAFERDHGIDTFQWDHQNPDTSKRFAEQADIGLTFSDITLAESGTAVLFSDKGKGRSVSLLPKAHVVIIPKSTIVPRMSQATRSIHEQVQRGEEVASCINFVTGPSNSADIEMNLVVGVHGPLRAAYILVEDR